MAEKKTSLIISLLLTFVSMFSIMTWLLKMRLINPVKCSVPVKCSF